MKDSSEWVRQEMVDKAANEVREERGCTIGEVKPNWVAKKLGVNASGEIYDKVYDWQRRAEAEGAVFEIEVPAEVLAARRAALERFVDEDIADFTRAVRLAGGAIDHAAGLRIADAELRANRAISARVDLLTLCREVEAERDTARAQVAELRKALAAAERREERLLGRLEQREIDEASTGGTVDIAVLPAAQEMNAARGRGEPGTSRGSPTATAGAMVGNPPVAKADGSIDEPAKPTGGGKCEQNEMPLVEHPSEAGGVDGI